VYLDAANPPAAIMLQWRVGGIDWEHRAFLPVELTPDPDALRQLGHGGGWITAVLRDDDGVRLLGIRPQP